MIYCSLLKPHIGEARWAFRASRMRLGQRSPQPRPRPLRPGAGVALPLGSTRCSRPLLLCGFPPDSLSSQPAGPARSPPSSGVCGTPGGPGLPRGDLCHPCPARPYSLPCEITLVRSACSLSPSGECAPPGGEGPVQPDGPLGPARHPAESPCALGICGANRVDAEIKRARAPWASPAPSPSLHGTVTHEEL